MTPRRGGGSLYVLLFIPYALAAAAASTPVLSFALAWLGSIAIIWLTLSGKIKQLADGRSVLEQVLRPIVLTQLIFVTYAALTSIFAFFEADGYYYLTQRAGGLVDEEHLQLLAEAQRFYVLAHAALAAGLLAGMDPKSTVAWRLRPSANVATLLTVVASICIASTIGLRLWGHAPQLAVRFETFGLVASVLSLVAALRSKQPMLMGINAAVYCTNLANALLSGWKEEVIVVLLLLAVFAYPMYRRTVMLVTPVVLAALLVVLPAYNNLFRQLSWYGGTDRVTAARMAYSDLRAGDVDFVASTWEFLTTRASEIELFTQYLRHTPAEHPYYGTTILRQALTGLVPRMLWPGKPSLETVAMQRVYDNGVILRESSTVSAKPQFIVDAYLSGGAIGIVIACFLYGLIASLAARLGERWFGGYLIGSGLVYNALLMSLWRGNAFEFLLNDVMWGYLIMTTLFFVGRESGWLVRAQPIVAPPRAVGLARPTPAEAAPAAPAASSRPVPES
ncbi:MAG: O-antigen polysaccharide polymerase Wzy [Gemmatimonadetes bacterium]|nr:O-antigen polysaccharide polymerase Wzy [Gemmatimonadota bacterium]